MAIAKIIEIFSSLQGEGIRAGEPHVFIRFAGCNLHCSYCDTPESMSFDSGVCMGPDDVLNKMNLLNQEKRHKTISITGGEPLLQHAFLLTLLPAIKECGFEVYLDTNGTLPEALKTVLEWIDVIAMDIKLPADCGVDLWGTHRLFMEIGRRKLFVKVVLTSAATDGDINAVIALIRDIDPSIPLVLQPVTEVNGVEMPPADVIATWYDMSRAKLADARLVPQMQHVWGVK